MAFERCVAAAVAEFIAPTIIGLRGYIVLPACLTNIAQGFCFFEYSYDLFFIKSLPFHCFLPVDLIVGLTCQLV